MLRRRLFSSAMASVMALSSIAVVANAEETTKYVKTEAELDKLVNETYGDDWRADELPAYGSKSTDTMLDALEAAAAILDASDSEAKDFTVAYAMVEAVANSLKKYTAAELQKLIDDNQSIIDTNNIYNEELGDNIYDTTAYGVFEDAFVTAENYVDSESPADITDAYIGLKDAKAGLAKLQAISKADYRSALKQYEAIKLKLDDYETWRKGTYDWDNHTDVFGTVVADYEAVEIDVENGYKAIDEIPQFTGKTSSTDIVAAYKKATDAVWKFGTWKADDVSKATKSGVQKLIDKYHNEIIHEYNAATAEDLLQAIAKVTGGNFNIEHTAADDSVSYIKYNAETTTGENAWVVTYGGGNVIDATITIKSGVRFYIPLDASGYWTGDDLYTSSDNKAPTNKPVDGKGSWRLVSANSYQEIAQFVAITELVADDASTEKNITLGDAYDIAVKYLAANNETYSALLEEIALLDTTGSITETRGRTAEWTLVYRALYYALTAKYEGSVAATYTKKDVEKLIDDCYTLADLTGDAAVFAPTHNDVTAVRQEAIEWLREANACKTYKDHQAFDGNVSSDAMYDALNKKYTALNNEYNTLKASFGDVYDYIADIYTKIDKGDLDATSTLLKALEKTAFALSTVDDVVYPAWGPAAYYDNYAFASDRTFNEFNRVITTEGWDCQINSIGGGLTLANGYNPTHKALVDACKALKAAVEDQNVVTAKGDVNNNGTAYELTDALETLKIANKVAERKVDIEVVDHNGNGAVDLADALAILKKANGIG